MSYFQPTKSTQSLIRSDPCYADVILEEFSPYQVSSRSQILITSFLCRFNPIVESITIAPFKLVLSAALVKTASPEVVKYGIRLMELALTESQSPCL